jgi:hypothetical protein
MGNESIIDPHSKLLSKWDNAIEVNEEFDEIGKKI